MSTCQQIMIEKKLNTKWINIHLEINDSKQSTIERVHLIAEQTMDINYLANMDFHQSIDE